MMLAWLSAPLRVAVTMLAPLCVAATLLAAPALGADSASLPDIEDEVMCPVCGTLLEHSQAPQAERERALIRRLIAEGRTKEEIKDELVDEYGEQVLATPGGSGFDLAAWIVPGLALVALGSALGFAAWRRSRRGSAGGDREPAALSAEDQDRLERDISSYEL